MQEELELINNQLRNEKTISHRVINKLKSDLDNNIKKYSLHKIMSSYWLYKNKNLMKEIEKKDIDIENLKNDDFLNKEQFKKLEETIDAYKKQNADLKKENNDVNFDFNIIKGEYEELIKNNEDLKNKNSKQIIKMGEMTLEIDNLEQKIKKLEVDLKKKNDKSDNKNQKEIQNITNEIGRLNIELQEKIKNFNEKSNE